MKEDTHSGSVRIVMLLCWILSLAVLMIEAVDGRLNSTKELDAVFLLLWLVLEAESFRETFKFNGAEMLWVILAFISVIVMLASQSGWMRWVVLLRGPSVLRRFNDEKTFEVIGEMIVVVLILFFVVPFFNIIAVALSAPGQIINVIPQNIDFFALNYVIHDTAFLKSFLNSIFITVAGTLIGTIAMAMAAYPLSRPELPFRRGWMVFYMITMYFGGGMAPAIVLMNALGLMNTIWALILPGTISIYNMLLIKGTYEGIPIELNEVARIDGASEMCIYFKIILPLSKAIIATTAFMQIVNFWNNYTSSILYITTNTAIYPVQAYIQNFMNRNPMEIAAYTPELLAYWNNLKTAYLLVAIVPVICAYPFMYRFLQNGLTVGAVKG